MEHQQSNERPRRYFWSVGIEDLGNVVEAAILFALCIPLLFGFAWELVGWWTLLWLPLALPISIYGWLLGGKIGRKLRSSDIEVAAAAITEGVPIWNKKLARGIWSGFVPRLIGFICGAAFVMQIISGGGSDRQGLSASEQNREELKVRRAELEMRGVLGTLLAKEADGTITETESETLEEMRVAMQEANRPGPPPLTDEEKDEYRKIKEELAAEPAPVAETTIAFDALDEAQHAVIQEVFAQIESEVPEPQRPFAYPAIATQLRTQAASAPEEDRDAILYAAQELERRAAAAGTSTGTDSSAGGKRGEESQPEYSTFLALCRSRDATPESIQEFIDLRSDVNAKAENGDTPLHMAAEYNKNPEVITTLIKAGAEVNAKNMFGRTALDNTISPMIAKKPKPKNAEVLRAAGGKLGKDLP